MTERKQTPEEICDEYLLKQQLYHSFSEEIKKIIGQVLNNGEIKIYGISSREKAPEKLKEKIARKEAKGIEYKILEDIEDLAGVRVVTYLESHQEQAVNLIYREFEGSRPGIQNKYDPQGYRGTHFVLQLDETRTKLPEYVRYKGLKCEVQVASILYHAWSEIEHDVIYKPGGDLEKLRSLGLDDIENSFHEIMAQHLEEATIQFDLLYKKHKEVLHAGKVIYSDFLSDIRNAQSNDEIASILDIADKFSHKKPEEAVQMVEETIKIPPIDPKVIHKFVDKELYGKNKDNLLEKCVDILKHFHVRYWNTERILSSLFLLALHPTKKVSEEAMKAIKDTVKYNNTFIKRFKNLYPQKTALEFIKKIPLGDRKKNFQVIIVISEEILSLEVEGTEWSSVDTLTFSSGALVPNDFLKEMRRETIDFVVELFEQSSDLKDRMALVRVLLRALETPHNVVYGEDIKEMIREDGKRLVEVLTKFIFSSDKMSNYLIAQEIEETLIRLLGSDDLKTAEVQALYARFQENKDYGIFCTLVGDIREFRNLDEDWQEAEKRRANEVKALVKAVTERGFEKWYKKLNDFAGPLQEGAIDSWKYSMFKLFITRLTENKMPLATALLKKAVEEKSALAQEPFVTTYLFVLRKINDFKSWDSLVAIICKKKMSNLASSIAVSLNLDMGADLDISIREKDIKLLSALVGGEKPFKFVNSDDFQLRYMVFNTLTRIFDKNPSRIESLIVQEIKNHKNLMNMYLRELPFASHRKWMSFRDWSADGIKFIKQQLVQLRDLDWHMQGMMLELETDPIHIILEIFKKRIEKDKKNEEHYEVIPYHFNPDLQKYIAEHEKYITEMVGWLKDMTPDWSVYNWNVTHFIQRIGGASYSSILLKLIENADKAMLKKAAYALNAFDGADFSLCFEIVKRTDDEDILNRIGGAMSGTGVVSGEDGLARAYEAKAKELESYITSKDARIKVFATKMRKAFEESAQREYQRANTRKKTRQIEFRG
ncbi:hypothetical protein A2911_00155 [Candidatus Nomurabacteria bacterium RIFCSPLOWO2_01_FULL_40_15]|uniref:RelA/SpoT domain-containing protein n=1 Tax=Candidatus Nomurabacteria bacterium RIFCSPLOWO2_01_FULL_40_15 TaxID=1801772 RepID=A0A1F6X8F5_9BACT|nr:MAG: hypothetical protein A2911_00155 [Candidatus Nomurabacteria bacterium RIFCSPLOWO2_01_FULL_40_15]